MIHEKQGCEMAMQMPETLSCKMRNIRQGHIVEFV